MRFLHHPHRLQRLLYLGAAAVTTIGVAACRDVPFTAPAQADIAADAPRLASVATPIAHPGRALAANCFQCHGTNGFAKELKIAGESANEIIGELNEMRAESPRKNIMNVHASAYTSQEIALIADYFAKVGR